LNKQIELCQIPHAAGVGYGVKFHGENTVILTFIGDGGTSEGDFHEALNFAEVWKVALITVIQNKHYAIPLPVHKQTASKTLAPKGVILEWKVKVGYSRVP